MRYANGEDITIEGDGVIQWIYGEKSTLYPLSIPYTVDDIKPENYIKIAQEQQLYNGTSYCIPAEIEFKRKIVFRGHYTLFYRLKE